MAIKRKTHLNLSGSHHTLDSDNAFVGGTLYITGALSASTNVSAQGNLFVQGDEQLTGSLYAQGSVYASFLSSSAGILVSSSNVEFAFDYNYANRLSLSDSNSGNEIILSTGSLSYTGVTPDKFLITANAGKLDLASSDRISLQGNTEVTGSLNVSDGITGSIQYVDAAASVPFIAGNNITATYNSLGQWELTGSGGGGGSNFFTEIDSTHIYTTSSVAMAHLSASQGAEITGSVAIEGTLSQGAASNNTVSNLSFANGNALTATGYYSHAEGVGSQATNDAAHAEGYNAIASGYAAHAEGWVAQAQGGYSHAEGSGSIAQGIASHAEGWLTTAKGSGSLAAGLGTIATGPVDGADPTTTQAAFGKYNVESATALFVVGDGTSNANRHDALRLVSGSQGTSMQVTGSANVSGPLSSSGAISTQGNLRVQGNTQLTGAVYIGNTLSASNNISTAGNLLVQGNEQVTGSIFVQGAVSAFQGIFTQLTGSLSGTTAGLPFLVNGGNMAGVNYNTSTGQWEITGSAGTSVAGANTQIQFNADGVHGASSDFAFYSASYGQYPAGTLSVPTASIGNALFVAGVNITPITKNATTTGPGGTTSVSSANFLSFTNFQGSTLGNYSIASFDFSVVAVSQTSDDYGSWNFTATGIKDSTGATKLIDYLEVSQGSSGSDGDTWAVNVYDNMSVGLTGSTSTQVQWWMKASMKAALSGSGNTRY